MNQDLAPIRSLLRRQTALVLATADEAARARSTPLFFIADEELRLYWFSSRKSLHSRNCALNPRVSVAVFCPARSWQQIEGVQMEGTVEVVGNRTQRRSIANAYCTRFALGEEFTRTLRRSALYCFTPSRLLYLNNARGFGYKFELRLGGDSENSPLGLQ